MKICIITTGTGGLPMPPVKGGAVENLVDMYLKQNENTYHDEIVVYSCYSADAEKEANNYKYSSFRYINTNSFSYWLDKRIRFLVNKIKGVCLPNAFISRIRFNDDFDLVLIENRPDYGDRIRRFYSGRLVLHVHNDIIDSSQTRYKIDGNTYDNIITVSNYITNCVKKKIPDCKATTLLNGIDYWRFAPTENNALLAKVLRRKYNLKENDKVILFAGRINREKGIKELLEAFLMLPDENVKLVIVGSSIYGYTAQDDFTKSIKGLAEIRREKVIFTGYVDYNNMPVVYHVADVIVIPSVWEDPSPLTVYESLATGIPLIVSNSGGIPEIVAGSSATIVERNQDYVSHLSETIATVLQKGRTMQESNINRAKELSSENYCNMLHGLLSNKS